MADDDIAKGLNGVNTLHQSLKPYTIERVFTDRVMDLGQILVLDDIDILPDGFRVRCHDLNGQLPEIITKNSGDTFQDKNTFGLQVCKLLSIADLRDQIVTWLPGSRFLPPTSIDGKALVGLQALPKTWIIEGNDFLAAYHELRSQTVG
jgi:hypothetical protein